VPNHLSHLKVTNYPNFHDNCFLYMFITYVCIPKNYSLVLPSFELHIYEIMQYIFFHVWLFWGVRNSKLCLWDLFALVHMFVMFWFPLNILCMKIPQFVYYSVDEHEDYLQFLNVINNAALNILALQNWKSLWPGGIYPRNAKMVQYWEIYRYNYHFNGSKGKIIWKSP